MVIRVIWKFFHPQLGVNRFVVEVMVPAQPITSLPDNIDSYCRLRLRLMVLKVGWNSAVVQFGVDRRALGEVRH